MIHLLILVHLARYDTGRVSALKPIWLAVALFAGFLCRPTGALMILGVLVYVLLKAKKALIQMVPTLGLLTAALVSICMMMYHQPLPPYYLQGSGNLWANLTKSTYAQLFSPARGIFVYQPYLIFAAVGVIILAFKHKLGLLLTCLLPCALLNMLPIASLERWWAGWSYSSRLFTEFMPVFFLAFTVSWKELILPLRRPVVITTVILFTFVFSAAIWMNTYQGLYNLWVQHWNGGAGSEFNIDQNPEYIFSWKYPQFLASPQLVRERNDDWARKNTP